MRVNVVVGLLPATLVTAATRMAPVDPAVTRPSSLTRPSKPWLAWNHFVVVPGMARPPESYATARSRTVSPACTATSPGSTCTRAMGDAGLLTAGGGGATGGAAGCCAGCCSTRIRVSNMGCRNRVGRHGRGNRGLALAVRTPAPHYPIYLATESMMVDRRTFVRSLAVAAPAFSPKAIRYLAQADASGPRGGAPDDEDYWAVIQRAFDCDRTMINLNNGGVSPSPTVVLDQMMRDLRFSNELPVEHMWRTLEPRVESVRTSLAGQFGCDPEEMAITRNASEAHRDR